MDANAYFAAAKPDIDAKVNRMLDLMAKRRNSVIYDRMLDEFMEYTTPRRMMGCSQYTLDRIAMGEI